MAIVVGTNGNDSLVGTTDDDTINALKRIAPGIDTVDGLAGIDTLVVNAASETDGVQLSVGGSPVFAVRSNSGNYYVDAYNVERVQFTGGAGNDTIQTGNHGGSVNGGAGIDSWIADLSAVVSNIGFTLGTTVSIAAADLASIKNLEQIDLTTGAGSDAITGGALGDRIVTGAGNDRINALTVIAGGSGDAVDGGADIDTLIVDASAESEGVQLSSGGSPTFAVRSNSGNFYVDAYNMEKVKFTGGSANDTINTGDHGGTVDGGAGLDFWTANLGALTTNVAFTLGTTSSIAAAGLSSILNLERIDLTTGSGSDTLVGGLQGDRLTAGAGNDTLDARTRLSGASATDVVDGGADIDTLIVDASAESEGVQLSSGGSPTFAMRSNTGNFYVDAYNMEKVRFTGGSANDTINTGDHGGTVDGGAGLDFWTANLGALTTNVAFTLGTTSSIAAAGLSSILNLERIDLTTGSGTDTITGGALADRVVTGAGNDQIDIKTVFFGGSGDVVDGGADIDTLIVDASAESEGVQLSSGGSPTFAVRSNSGNFYVDAYNMEKVKFTGGSANDTINTGDHGGTVDGGAGLDFWTANLGALTTNVAFTLGTTSSIAAAGLSSILNLERIDLTTGSGSDTLIGGNFADRLATGGGNDTINAGRRGAGSSPVDVVDGGQGSDTLIVDAGLETMGVQLNSGGSPTFAVRSNSGNFYVDAYNMEKVKFTGGSGNDVLRSASGNDVLVTGDGKDALWGGAGNDSLSGGAESDLFGFGNTNNGTDTVADFSGQTSFGGGSGEHDVLAFNGVLVGTFAYLGSGAFTGTGNTEARASAGRVFVDFDGNGAADITINVAGLASASQLAAADFTFV